MTVHVELPCDVLQIDETGYVWTFLDEAADPARILPGAIVVAADDEQPAYACVIDIVPGPGREIVHLEILPGDPYAYLDAARRANLLPSGQGQQAP